jgi:hypothetical protein
MQPDYQPASRLIAGQGESKKNVSIFAGITVV